MVACELLGVSESDRGVAESGKFAQRIRTLYSVKTVNTRKGVGLPSSLAPASGMRSMASGQVEEARNRVFGPQSELVADVERDESYRRLSSVDQDGRCPQAFYTSLRIERLLLVHSQAQPNHPQNTSLLHFCTLALQFPARPGQRYRSHAICRNQMRCNSPGCGHISISSLPSGLPS